MRSEKMMYDIILAAAEDDLRVRAVYLNGSRANPNAPKDVYQDYDIVYVVTDTASFLTDRLWVRKFGDIAMLQEPDYMDFLLRGGTEAGAEVDAGAANPIAAFKSYTWLTFYKDGNRIDLHIETIEAARKNVLLDKLTVVLMDKDGILPTLPAASDEDYRAKPPTADAYFCCCNEFWWCLNNVAKGVARDELPYAMEMFNHYVRDMLNKMVEWHIGVCTDFAVCAGKMGKYYKKYLSNELYGQYLRTYPHADADDIWEAVFAACGLFNTLAEAVAKRFGFFYNTADEQSITAYLIDVKNGKLEQKA